MKIKPFVVLTLLILSASLAACSGKSAAEGTELDGTSWVLFVFLNSQPIEGFEPTILFKNGRVSGNAGCNRYGGSYTVDGDRIEFGTIGGTEMYCMEPEGIMEREMAYLEIFGEVESFSIEEGILFLHVDGGKALGFEKIDCDDHQYRHRC